MLGKMLVFHLWKNVPGCHTQPAKATQRIASLTYLSPLILLKLQVSSASLPRSTRERTRACQRKTMEVKSKKLLKKSLTEWGKKVWKCRKPPCFFGEERWIKTTPDNSWKLDPSWLCFWRCIIWKRPCQSPTYTQPSQRDIVQDNPQNDYAVWLVVIVLIWSKMLVGDGPVEMRCLNGVLLGQVAPMGMDEAFP